MADIRSKLSTVAKSLKDAIEEAITLTDMRNLASDAAKAIRERTRQGIGSKGPNFEGRPLKPLKPSTIAQRRKKHLHPSTSAARSNLTETGRLLDSIKGEALSEGKAVVRATGVRRGGLKNEDLARFMEEGDSSRNRPKREFLNLTKSQLNELVGNLEKQILEKINRKLTKLK